MMQTYKVTVVRTAVVTVDAETAGEAVSAAEDRAFYALGEQDWTEEYTVLPCAPEPRIRKIEP